MKAVTSHLHPIEKAPGPAQERAQCGALDQRVGCWPKGRARAIHKGTSRTFARNSRGGKASDCGKKGRCSEAEQFAPEICRVTEPPSLMIGAMTSTFHSDKFQFGYSWGPQ